MAASPSQPTSMKCLGKKHMYLTTIPKGSFRSPAFFFYFFPISFKISILHCVTNKQRNKQASKQTTKPKTKQQQQKTLKRTTNKTSGFQKVSVLLCLHFGGVGGSSPTIPICSPICQTASLSCPHPRTD